MQKKTDSDIRANLLRGMVFCGACERPMTSMVIDKKKLGVIYESRYYYKCETEGCVMYGKSARAAIVLDAAFQPFLNMHENGLLTKQSHEEIMKRVKIAVNKKNRELNSKIVSQQSKISKLKAQYEDTKEYLIHNQEASKHFNLDELKKSVKDEEVKLVKLKNALAAEKEVILNYEEYLKLFRAIPVILSNVRYMKVMDELLRFFFLNFTIHPYNNTFRKGSNATCNIKEPFAGFLNHDNFVNGAQRAESCTPI